MSEPLQKMHQLMPCPFCGDEAHTRQLSSVDGRLYSVSCSTEGCYGYETQAWYELPRDADEAWNRRAKWTCRMVRASGVDEKRGDKRAWPVCSECGGAIRSNDKFCPNCGARVVEE